MNAKLSLMIATALLATACGKEKAQRPAQQPTAETAVAAAPVQQQQTQVVQQPTPVQHTPVQAAPATTHEVPPPVAVAPQVVPAPVQAPAPQAIPVRVIENHANTQSCRAVTDTEIAALFDRWNASLKTGRPEIVVANYAADSILLPTVSNKVRHTAAEKLDYFQHFLENQPVGEINERFIKIGCNTALDAGVYTFKFSKTGNQVVGRYSYTYEWNGDKWLITSHHSSAMPEKAENTEANKAHVH
ncbi:MAG: cag pathogenicity island protein Cag5 [Alysiella sp.]|uniref:cag pathogenicity island protein Cag5 n=1 Tax=Alysiella sp. TaxID=1872483 RepID=UPI0026DC5E93|nr:cag pathogenicity island protein Cag5 [Alysiella sp.]MDO4434315.1 cag pathogenicity island protein Cag5 [Alysiella sp.]